MRLYNLAGRIGEDGEERSLLDAAFDLVCSPVVLTLAELEALEPEERAAIAKAGRILAGVDPNPEGVLADLVADHAHGLTRGRRR